VIASLLVGTLAVTWAWEALRVLSPWGLPSWLLPFALLGFGLIFSWPDWHLAVGIAGAAGVVQYLINARSEATAVQLQRRGRIPPLP
jgi:hypothetical protein